LIERAYVAGNPFWIGVFSSPNWWQLPAETREKVLHLMAYLPRASERIGGIAPSRREGGTSTQQCWPRVGHTSSTACQKPSARSAMASSGSHGKGAPFEIEKQLLPRLRALTHAVDQAGELLLVLGRRPNDNQKALCRVLQPGPHVDAVDPEVRNASPRDRTGVTHHWPPFVACHPVPFAVSVV